MEEHNLIVEGYAFANEEDACLAREELKKVHFFDTKMDYSNTENVLMLFQKILEERVFRTQIGMDYLHRLQSLLRERGVEPDRIPVIPINAVYRPQINKQQRPQTPQRVEMHEKQREHMLLRSSLIINAAMVILVIILFTITLKSDNPNILNYEKALVNKYAAWEQNLSERENKVREAERQYHILEEDSQ